MLPLEGIQISDNDAEDSLALRQRHGIPNTAKHTSSWKVVGTFVQGKWTLFDVPFYKHEYMYAVNG